MTRTGAVRLAYRAIEAPPSRFYETELYREWCKRADAWGGL